MKRPKKVLTSKVIHKNPFYQIILDQYVKRNGKTGKYYMLSAREFVIVIATSKNNQQIHMVKNWRYPIQRYNWEFVMGWREKNETLLLSAKRELLEELGMRSKKWKRLGWFYHGPGISNQRGYVYLAEDVYRDKNAKLDDDEIADRRIYSQKEVQEMISKKKIIDAPSLMGAMHFFDHIRGLK